MIRIDKFIFFLLIALSLGGVFCLGLFFGGSNEELSEEVRETLKRFEVRDSIFNVMQSEIDSLRETQAHHEATRERLGREEKALYDSLRVVVESDFDSLDKIKQDSITNAVRRELLGG